MFLDACFVGSEALKDFLFDLNCIWVDSSHQDERSCAGSDYCGDRELAAGVG